MPSRADWPGITDEALVERMIPPVRGIGTTSACERRFRAPRDSYGTRAMAMARRDRSATEGLWTGGRVGDESVPA